ncbi:8-oxo-dGTP diphosphatase [Allopseudospirillum japonicum]|uniref:8-oxo-dGTP diphosphatase n=1 Tax=Allopseudospirillum japonicum TaxID=64971 RepID=A0A1H6QEQ9_9GAMM|nr:Nudix family hydrolase [Allopseudospirillum japonicum]SEI40376.1 8-oxo-dGTP diphosphatase [Allopseudospirillum japonicum]
MSKCVRVAVAVIVRDHTHLLIARRHSHQDQGGLWEFPGGKLEVYETGYQALVRELEEEVGIHIRQARPLIQVRHDYANQQVLLDVWQVLDFQGEAYGREGQEVRWVALDTLADYAFPAANQAIVQAVRLPDQYLITPEPQQGLSAWLAQLEQGLTQAGPQPLVQIRAHSLKAQDYFKYAYAATELAHQYQARVILNATPDLLQQIPAQGVHLCAWQLAQYNKRPIEKNYFLSCAVHSPEQLAQAQRLQADWVCYSPILPTNSHPETTGLGWQALQNFCQQAKVPVYALGGMRAEHLARVQALGAQGIAGIRCFFNN